MDERPNEDKVEQVEQVEQVERLLSRISLRDAAAFKSLYALVSPRLMAVAYRVLQDRALAEDVLQEVFIKVWNGSVPRPPGQPKTLAWLCVTTRNRAIDVIRKKRPETPLSWLDDNGDEHVHDVQDDAHSPLTNLLAQEDGQRLGQCMERLASEPRQAVLLAFYEGLTHPQIATRMQRPLGTIKAWTRRSMLRLKDCMEETV
jgi:RNA polymerase sigma-70 factor (ECF subfamily)